MKKRMKLALVGLLMVVLLSACSQGNGGASPDSAGSQGKAPAAGKELRIGVSYQNLQNEFILNIQNALRSKAKELNVELLEADGQGKAENQIAQVENYITQKVDAIIINPFDRNGTAPAIDKAIAANIPIIVVNSQVSNLDKATAFVGSDDVVAGKMEMQLIVDKLGGKGNIIIMHGPNGNSAEISRTEGNKEVLSQNTGMKVLAEQAANWDRAQALSLMENWLQTYEDIDAVIAQNDEMALGAYKAIEAAKKEKDILVVGIDAIPDALKSVEGGKMVGTVFQDAGGQGKKAMEVAILAAKGEKVNKSYYIPFRLVTAENLSQYKK